MGKILSALPALVVGILSVACAWLYFQSEWKILALTLTIEILGVLVGIVCYFGGPRMLPNRPVFAVYLMDGWILAPMMLAILVGSTIIYLGVWLEPPKNASVETENIRAAAFAALSGFLTTAFIDRVTGADKDWVGAPIRRAFFAAYDRSAHPLPRTPEKWVFSEDPVQGVTGWGFKARHIRARKVQDAL
jgi:hypothetical protein